MERAKQPSGKRPSTRHLDGRHTPSQFDQTKDLKERLVLRYELIQSTRGPSLRRSVFAEHSLPGELVPCPANLVVLVRRTTILEKTPSLPAECTSHPSSDPLQADWGSNPDRRKNVAMMVCSLGLVVHASPPMLSSLIARLVAAASLDSSTLQRCPAARARQRNASRAAVYPPTPAGRYKSAHYSERYPSVHCLSVGDVGGVPRSLATASGSQSLRSRVILGMGAWAELGMRLFGEALVRGRATEYEAPRPMLVPQRE